MRKRVVRRTAQAVFTLLFASFAVFWMARLTGESACSPHAVGRVESGLCSGSGESRFGPSMVRSVRDLP